MCSDDWLQTGGLTSTLTMSEKAWTVDGRCILHDPLFSLDFFPLRSLTIPLRVHSNICLCLIPQRFVVGPFVLLLWREPVEKAITM
jgi:hypothetical protein